jgi:hypothetical protein
MSRKITSGIVGRAVLGNLTTNNNSLQSVVTNANVLLEPNGTGIVQSTKDLQINAQNSLRLADGDSSNFIALRAPATVSSDVTLTLPTTAGTANQTLTTDGTGTLSWVTTAVSVSNQTADATTYYPALTTATTGTITTVSTSNTKLSFVPSTGTLTATAIGSTTASIGSASITANTASSSTSTGALIVTGGLGVGGAIYAGSIQSTPVGSTARSSGAFTTLTSNGATTFTAGTASTTTGTGTLVVTGGVGISGQLTAATIVETSSIAFKENINTIDNALDSIMQLVGVTYDRKDSKEHEAGLIAEDVNKVLPDLVSKDANGDPHGIKYSKLTAYLVEAVKSLKIEIDKLKNN